MTGEIQDFAPVDPVENLARAIHETLHESCVWLKGAHPYIGHLHELDLTGYDDVELWLKEFRLHQARLLLERMNR